MPNLNRCWNWHINWPAMTPMWLGGNCGSTQRGNSYLHTLCCTPASLSCYYLDCTSEITDAILNSLINTGVGWEAWIWRKG